MLLKDRVVLLTNSIGAMGRALAMAFAREGARILVSGHPPSSENLSTLVAEIRQHGGDALAIPGDLREGDRASGLVGAALTAFGQIDVLVTIARANPVAGGVNPSETDWDETFRADLKAVFLCARAVLPQMKAQRHGTILNVSAGATAGVVGTSEVAAQGAAHALTKSLADEGAPYGIRVNAIAPGLLATEDALERVEERPLVQAAIPLGRLGTPEDIAGIAVFLCSDLASFITGEILHVDGGWPCRKPLNPGRRSREPENGGES